MRMIIIKKLIKLIFKINQLLTNIVFGKKKFFSQKLLKLIINTVFFPNNGGNIRAFESFIDLLHKKKKSRSIVSYVNFLGIEK